MACSVILPVSIVVLVGAVREGVPAVLDVEDGQPQQLDHGVVVREVAAGLGDLAQLVVQALDGYLELSRQPGP